MLNLNITTWIASLQIFKLSTTRRFLVNEYQSIKRLVINRNRTFHGTTNEVAGIRILAAKANLPATSEGINGGLYTRVPKNAGFPSLSACHYRHFPVD